MFPETISKFIQWNNQLTLKFSLRAGIRHAMSAAKISAAGHGLL